MNKIFPRNLTARAAYRVAGNPESTRLESGVGNCFPGLEYDHRNLDRRFLPGLVVEFVSADEESRVNLQGARVLLVDARDPGFSPDLFASSEEKNALRQLQGELAGASESLARGDWFVSALTQSGRRVELRTADENGQFSPLDGLVVWRLVRSLEQGAVELELTARTMPNNEQIPPPIVLHGWRRRYTDSVSGELSAAYQPGELTQSLCSPWQHDFRDCGCFYWASNHPDVVQVEDRPDEQLLSSGAPADPNRALERVRWLRSDRAPERSSEARETYGLNRPIEMDHYEINLRWQELPIVIQNKETSSVYRPRKMDSATPFANATEMADHLTYLATLEHVLILEYLYAYSSVHTSDEIPDGPLASFLRDDVRFVRHFLLLVAVNEMQHLRWANQLLWELREHQLIDPKKYGPSLGVSPTVPASDAGGPRPRALRPLTREVVKDFIAVERPSGQIEGQYARVVVTLRQDKQTYPESLFQLASRIVNEGQEHFLRFREIESVMRQYQGVPWLRNIQLGQPDDPKVQQAIRLYGELVGNLRRAYATGSVTDRQHIITARTAMTNLQTLSETLAAQGIGIPYF
jgi:hypothetical protein